MVLTYFYFLGVIRLPWKGREQYLKCEIEILCEIELKRTLFFLVQFKKFPNPSSKSNDIAYFFAYFHPLVIRLICRKAYLAMHTQPSNI